MSTVSHSTNAVTTSADALPDRSAHGADAGQAIDVQDLTKFFRRRSGYTVRAIDHISIHIDPGEFLVLLGPSGCGKTTLLRCLAGLESPDGGEIRYGDRVVYSADEKIDVPPENRRTAMLFQSYALWPHMRVFDNVAYPLRSDRSWRGTKANLAAKVEAALSVVGCSELASQYPNEISGGQQQRVALARALVRDETVIYFDEPLSNVDTKLRGELKVQLKSLQKKLGFSAVYVTHDQGEALDLADRIAVLRNGSVVQVGPPQEIFQRPNSAYVARFMGSVNEFVGTVSAVDPDGIVVDTDTCRVGAKGNYQNLRPGEDVIVMCRLSACQLSQTKPDEHLGGVVLEAVVTAQTYVGTHFEVQVSVLGQTYAAWTAPEDIMDVGTKVWFTAPAGSLFVVPNPEANHA